jgi:peptidoglycan/xylan/chitin deacetylase (PgdA/CDA1 family)
MKCLSAGKYNPAINPGKLYPVFAIVAAVIIAATSCKQSAEKEPEAPAPDSAVIRRQQQQHIRDSLMQHELPAKKKIYLTFDDGPNAGTLNVLKAVQEEQVPVTFFVVAKHVFDSPWQTKTWDSLKADVNIEICNHSYSHAGNRYTRFYSSPQKVIDDFRRSHDSLHFSNRIARMPGRNAWRIDSINHTDVKESRRAIDSLHLAGFDIMGWDLEWTFNHRTFSPDADTALLLRRMQNLLNDSATKTPGHLVLLAHDQAFRTEKDVQLLKAFFASLKNNPYYELRLAGTYPGTVKN